MLSIRSSVVGSVNDASAIELRIDAGGETFKLVSISLRS
jgi:hypothetical protein